MRIWACRVGLAALILLASGAEAGTPGTASQAPDDWRAQLVIGDDDAAQQRLYSLIRRQPLSDNAVLVPWLSGNLSKLRPVFAFELSRRLFDEDRGAALEWFIIGRLRLRYAAARCTDDTAADALVEVFYGKAAAATVGDYLAEHGQDELAALRRVAVRRDLLDDDSAPAWACGHGIDAYGQALGLEKPLPRGPVKPAADWPAIRKAILDGLPAEAAAMERRLQEKSAGATAAATRPHSVPEPIAAGSRADKIKAIGAESLATIDASADPTAARFRPLKLFDLASAQVKLGDQPGARTTLADLQHILSAPGADAGAWQDGRIAALWVEAGAPAEAAAYVDGLSDAALRLRALGREGAALAQAHDLAAARHMLDRLERTPPVAPPANGAAGAPGPVFLPPRDLALRELGSALAQAHDVDASLHAADLIPEDSQLRVRLLSDIAVEQCASPAHGDAEATLQRAEVGARRVGAPGHDQAAEALAYGLASCDAAVRAAAVVHDLVPDQRTGTLVRVARRLAEHGDDAHARQVDEANPMSPDDVAGLLDLAQRQIARGDTGPARQNLALAAAGLTESVRAAKAADRPTYVILDALQPLGGLVAAQAKLGAYAEAIRVSAAQDDNNRPQFLLSVVAAAAERRDRDALREMLPGILEAATKAMPGIAIHALTQMASVLAQAGYQEEAQAALAEARRLGGRTLEFARAQAALGDLAGAGATVDGLPGTAANRAQARFDLALGRSDFPTALAVTATLTGSSRDSDLSRLSDAQAKAADLAGAMTSAWQIETLAIRGDALVKILKDMEAP